jgi:hypothetical protein
VNPYLLGLLSVVAILLALGSTVVVLVFLMTKRRLPVRPLIVATVAWAMFAWTQTQQAPAYDAAEIARIDQAHARFRHRLEAWRAAHGEYPSTLEEAGIQVPATPYGPVRYQAYRDAAGIPRYSLAVGDYVRNGFVDTWRSERGEWGLRID